MMERFVRRQHTRACAGARRLLGSVAAIVLITLAAVTVGLAGRSGGTRVRTAGFGTAGKVRTGFGGDDVANALAIQADGRIVAAGRKGRAFAVARYTPDGRLDRSFGTGGKAVTPFHLARARERAALRGAGGVAFAADGKIVAAGGIGSDFALARYLPNGRLDPTFGSGGKVVTDVGARPHGYIGFYWQHGANALAIQPDGKVITAGAGPRDFALVRYTEAGQLDPSFGGGGIVLTDFGSPGERSEDYALAVALQSDGKIVAAGWGRGSDFALARYLPDGQLDPTFGSGGKVVTPVPGEDFSTAYALAIQPDGKLIAAGWGGTFPISSPVVVRYTPSGSLDPSFGGGGIAGGGYDSGAYAALLDRQGRIVLAGDVNYGVYGGTPSHPTYHDAFYVALSRLTPVGRFDTTFGRRGTALTLFPLSHDLVVTAVALQPTGKLVAAGGSWRNRKVRHDFLLVRYRPNGRLDR
jgi:uncharacterized delta-60 repeat protein